MAVPAATVLQKSNSDAEDKIQVLRDEKLFLAQEKAQLEGQLKKVEGILKNYLRTPAS